MRFHVRLRRSRIGLRASFLRSLWTALADTTALGRVHNNLGAAHYQWGDSELALESFLRSLEYRRRSGSEPGEALSLTNVGLAYHGWGLLEQAREAYEGAIRISDRIDYTFGRAYPSLNRGELHLDEEEWDQAEERSLAFLEHYEAEGSSVTPSDAMGGRILNRLGLARVATGRGDAAEGIRILLGTLELARSVESLTHLPRTHLTLRSETRSSGGRRTAGRGQGS